MTRKPVYAISISARALLNLHSLNNEGSEGNQVQTRMVKVIYYDDKEQIRHESVNAISGDMLKHIQSEHLYRLAKERDLPMCKPAQRFDPNRISADDEYLNSIAGKLNEEAIDLMLQKCAVTDLEGTLITKDGAGKNRSLPRKSVAEFGWITGVPGAVDTASYFHVKYATERGDKTAATDDSGTVAGKQTPFHRPASSGVYAIVCNFETARIGYNDIAQKYPDDVDRQVRYQALLESVLYSFIHLNGAMRSAQMPHLMTLRGVVAVSYGVMPAPTVSPLNPHFEQELERTRDALNKLPQAETASDKQIIRLEPFADLAAFADVMQNLIGTTAPYALKVS